MSKFANHTNSLSCVSGDYEEARSKAGVAKVLNIIGPVLGGLAVIGAIIYVVIFFTGVFSFF